MTYVHGMAYQCHDMHGMAWRDLPMAWHVWNGMVVMAWHGMA